MSIIKFRKVRELFPNRKVRIVRTEQLWFLVQRIPRVPASSMAPAPTVVISQCNTLVHNTVVRAILQAYGKWWISTPWGAETAEPIETKLGTGDYVGDPTPHAQNEKCT